MRKLLPLLLSLLILPGLASGAEHYVSPSGSASWAQCTDVNTNCSLSTANSNVKPGDTVLLKGGTYETTIWPARSGNSNNHITYQAYLSQVPKITRASYGINLDEKDYIHIKGIKVDGNRIWDPAKGSVPDVNLWLRLADSHHNIIEGCTFLSAKGWGCVYLDHDSSYNKILNNRMDGCGAWNKGGNDDAGNLIQLECAERNLFEGNHITRGGHSPMDINGRYNVIRNNTISNQWYSDGRGNRCGELSHRPKYRCGYSEGYNVVEDNIFTRATKPVDAIWAQAIKVEGIQQIVRRNFFLDNDFEGISGAIRGKIPYTVDNKIFHNIFYDLGDSAWKMREYSTGDRIENNIFKNNIVYKTRQHPTNSDVDAEVSWILDATADKFKGNEVAFNSLVKSNPGDSMIFVRGIGRKSLSWYENNHAQHFHNNIEEVPEFISSNPSEKGDFRLKGTSLLIDAGDFLTRTSGSGTGKDIVVHDAGYFTDGFGIITGDLIQLEGHTQTARITSINYNTETLTLDRALTWTNGQGVSLAYEGSAPDIGAFEYGAAPSPTCPDGVCDPGECSSCPEDCTFQGCCGKEGCNPEVGEDCGNCGDCSCLEGICCDGQCINPECSTTQDCPSTDCRTFSCHDPGTCSASCILESEVTGCVSGDSCCPLGCTPDEDIDCGSLELTTRESRDTILSSQKPDYNFGKFDTFFLVARQDGGFQRGLLKFFGIISQDKVPRGATIKNAELTLTSTGTQGLTSPISFRVRRVLEPWSEGSQASGPAGPGDATWDHRSHDTQRWASDTGNDGGTDAGCSYPLSHTSEGEASKTFSSAPGEGEKHVFDVTQVVQHWADQGESSNHGFILIAPDQEGGARNYIRFATSDHSSPDLRPELSIEYSGGTQRIHRADQKDPLGCITMDELVVWIGNWKGNSKDYPMAELMGAVSLWKRGC